MNRFHIAMSWKTDRGSLASATVIIMARDHDHALSLAISRIKRDARRRYAGGMNASAWRINQ